MSVFYISIISIIEEKHYSRGRGRGGVSGTGITPKKGGGGVLGTDTSRKRGVLGNDGVLGLFCAHCLG